MWLSMIGGRSSQPFHAPDICYDADGWQYNLSSKAIPLDDGGEVHGLWMEANKIFPGQTKETEHIVFYFYLFPNAERSLSDGIVLFKLTASRMGTLEETLAIQEDFVRQFFNATTPAATVFSSKAKPSVSIAIARLKSAIRTASAAVACRTLISLMFRLRFPALLIPRPDRI